MKETNWTAGKIFLKALAVNINEYLLSSLSCITDFNQERANCPHYSSKIFSKIYFCLALSPPDHQI